MAERLALLSQLSLFLPPPLSGLLTSDQLSMAQFHALSAHAGLQAAEARTWWNVQDLGAGASVLTAQRDGREREVWVLQIPSASSSSLFSDAGPDTGDRVLLAALTGSLAAREKLIAELATCRAPRALPSTAPAAAWTRDEDWAHTQAHSQAHDRLDRLRDREAELEERERHVLKREKWVVDEMRKMAERSRYVHAPTWLTAAPRRQRSRWRSASPTGSSTRATNPVHPAPTPEAPPYTRSLRLPSYTPARPPAAAAACQCDYDKSTSSVPCTVCACLWGLQLCGSAGPRPASRACVCVNGMRGNAGSAAT